MDCIVEDLEVMDIDYELYKIVKKYRLNTYYPEWDMYYLAIDLINKLFSNIPTGTVVAIRGAGTHTKKLLQVIGNIEWKQKIHYIVDKNITGIEIEGIKVIGLSEVEKYGIELYITSSFLFGREMATELRRQNRNVKIIDLYEYFRINNLILNTEFYNIRPYIIHKDIYFYKERYANADSLIEKKAYLQSIIFLFIEIRDFLSVFESIEEYIKNGFDEDRKYEQARKDIQKLLQSIKEHINKEKKDIIINFIDCVPYEESKQMNYLQEVGSKGLTFDYAFSPYATTHGTLINMFRGEMVREGESHSFYKEKFTTSNSILLRELESAGYSFKYIAYPNLYRNLFEEKYLSKYNLNAKRSINHEGCSTRLQWMALKERLQNKMPGCYLIHNLAETHSPFVSPNEIGFDMNYIQRDEFSEEEWKIRSISMNYLDQQLQFYEDFYGENEVKIFMSDHGYKLRGYGDHLHRIIMTIAGNIPLKGHEERLYSHLHFNRLIKYILCPNKENYDDIFNSYIRYHWVDAYGPNFLKLAQNRITAKIQNGKINDKVVSRFFQYCAIRTKEFLYVKYFHGKELFFILPDIEHNYLQDKQYEENIMEFRSLCEGTFIDWRKDEFFSACKPLYEFLPYIDEESW